jgi:hypothetical protein
MIDLLIEGLCIKLKTDKSAPQQDMKSKNINILNRTFVKEGYRTLVHWKCDICERMFGSLRQMKEHKIEIHSH